MNRGGEDAAPCTRCNGSGMRDLPAEGEPVSQYAPCPVCHGYGYRSRPEVRHLPRLARSVVVAGAVVLAVVTLVVLSSH